MSSLDCLGLSRSTLVTKDIISQTLRYFQSAVAQKLFVDNVAWRREEVQLLWDLTFLRQLSCMPSQVSKHAEDALSHKVSNLGERVRGPICHNESVDDHINHRCNLLHQQTSFCNSRSTSTTPSISTSRGRRHFWLPCSLSQHLEKFP